MCSDVLICLCVVSLSLCYVAFALSFLWIVFFSLLSILLTDVLMHPMTPSYVLGPLYACFLKECICFVYFKELPWKTDHRKKERSGAVRVKRVSKVKEVLAWGGEGDWLGRRRKMEVIVTVKYGEGVREGERQQWALKVSSKVSVHVFLFAESLSKIGCVWQPGDSATA